MKTQLVVIGVGPAGLMLGYLLKQSGDGLRADRSHHTDDRQDNFDIYLPLWLARNNKLVFGALFLAGTVFAIARWLGA